MPVRLLQLEKAVADLAGPAVMLEAADAAVKVLAEQMKAGTAKAIGSDMRLRNFRGGPPVFKEQRSPGLATLSIGGGTYALADAGRAPGGDRPIYPRHRGRGRRKPALMTPRGPRRSVRSGRGTTGLRITDTYSPRALDEAVTAARLVFVDAFVKAV